LAAGQNARGRSGSERRQRYSNLRFVFLGGEAAMFELCQETSVQRLHVREQEHGEPLQVNPELVAQHISGIGQLGSYFR